MAKAPAPKSLVENVEKAILFIASRPQRPLKAKHTLRFDLGMYEYQRKSLQVPFNREVKRHKQDGFISGAACGELKTVGAAITLVAKTAGFSYEPEN